MLGRKIVSSSRDAFGPAPLQFPVVLEPVVRGPVVLTRRTRISLPRFGSGTADSKTPKTPRPPRALRPPKP
jgi:hypothetical protein